MVRPVLLDMTRAAARRWNGAQPTGIDRVCDAYARHFTQKAIAVIQIRGRAVILNRAASDNLMLSLDASRGTFRRTLAASLTMSAAAPIRRNETLDAFYINVGHSDFDLDAHWRWIRKRQLKPVYLLHDLIPITNPDVTTAHKSARHRGRVVSAIANAAGLVVNSQTTAKALTGFARKSALPMPPMLVSLIASGPLPRVRRHPVRKKTLFLSIGTVEHRKNPLLLLRVWSELLDRMGDATPRLVLAGSLGQGSEEVLRVLAGNPALAEVVSIRSDLDDHGMARLLAQSRAVLLPSLAEGYGIPLVEALERGVPVIGSNLESFRELSQGISTLLDPTDHLAWLEAVLDCIREGQEYRRQSDTLHRFNPPSWSQHFSMLERWLDQLQYESAHSGGPDDLLAAVA